MTIHNPITGDKLTIFCIDNDSPSDCYEAIEDKAIAVVMSSHGIDKERAILLLANSDYDHPVICNSCEFWAE